MKRLTIGQVARQAGVGIETIRFYERQGLLEPPARKESGYRQYDDEAVRRLQFIRRAKELGFTLKDIGELISLREDPEAGAGEIKARAQARLEEIEHKIADLQRMRDALLRLTTECRGQGPLSTCPILEALEQPTHQNTEEVHHE
jgi:MerR family mercuric resistance operon transcriptional regulator